MDDAVLDPSAEGTVLSPLVDVSRIPLTVVMELDETVLGNALRRLVTELRDDSEVIAGWGQGP
jgi:FXSXX-COOH protein